MNPELKQRLIGAAVVTALATIFVPMLFDDPVDNKDKTVTELPLPETPVKSTEISANKQQAAVKPAKTPNAATDEATAPGEEGVTDGEMTDDADAEANNAEPPVNETAPAQGTGTVAEAEQPPVVEEESEPLDTGVVPAVKPKAPVKQPAPVAVTPAAPKAVAPVKTATAPKQPPVAKTAEDAHPKPAAKTTPPKPVTPPPATATAPVPPKKPELVRYTIHAGSFSQQENASKLMKSLREKGIPVAMETTQSGKGPIYRLKIGPELDKKKAAANKAKLDKEGVVNVMITE